MSSAVTPSPARAHPDPTEPSRQLIANIAMTGTTAGVAALGNTSRIATKPVRMFSSRRNLLANYIKIASDANVSPRIPARVGAGEFARAK
jgi:hypothetical protein